MKEERRFMEEKRKGGTAQISAEDAFLLFDKWHSEDAIVYCVGTFFAWGLNLKGKVLSASREEISFGLPEQAVVTLRLDAADLMFLYGESKDAPFAVPEEAKEVSGFVIGLPFRVSVTTALAAQRGELTEAPPREKLFFMELPR